MRVDRLREFWTQVTSNAPRHWFGLAEAKGNGARNLPNQFSANLALMQGAKGFFTARPLSPWLQPSGTLEATSFYDTRELKRTLERLVDFDRLNAGLVRFSVGAVNVRTGNFVYFDTTTHTMRPEHVMASGALPPSFPNRNRRRALLGRRSGVQHAAAMGRRERAAPRHPGLSG
jgi:NTE family protein